MHVYHEIEKEGYLHGVPFDSGIIQGLREHRFYSPMKKFIKTLDQRGIAYNQMQDVFFQAWRDLIGQG